MGASTHDVNAPVDSDKAFRLGASYREADNWVDRGDSDSPAISSSFLWQPNDDFSAGAA